MVMTPSDTNGNVGVDIDTNGKAIKVVNIKLLHLVIIMLAFLVSGASLMEVRMTKLEASVSRIVTSEIKSHNADATSHGEIVNGKISSHNLDVTSHPGIRQAVDSVVAKLDRIIQNGVDSKIAITELRTELRIISRKL